MKLLLDVNVGGSISEWLKATGHDVVEVKDKDARMSDLSILNLALK
jgi:predicted nuclease of predicted toxin-antitoxin system